MYGAADVHYDRWEMVADDVVPSSRSRDSGQVTQVLRAESGSIVFFDPGTISFNPMATPFQESDMARREDAALLLRHYGFDKLLVGKQLSARINELMEAAKDEEPQQAPVSPQSLRSFFGFMKMMGSDVAAPSLSIDTEGNLWARWRRSAALYLVIKFPSVGDFHWAMAFPDSLSEQARSLSSGTASGQTLAKLIATNPSIAGLCDSSSGTAESAA